MNNNGIQDDGELGINGVTVNLLDATGTELASTTTDADGLYAFNFLFAGQYQVEFIDLPTDYIYAPQNAGADDTVDSDVNTTTGRTSVFNLAVGEQNDTIDAGVANPPKVVGRYVFYNNSLYDGNNPATNSNDDAAVDDTKKAFEPGQNASTANYSIGVEGINGIMFDISNLPVDTLTADDFIFKIGTGNDTSVWTSAPTPASITVRHGDGEDGTSRVTITWDEGAVVDQWLQITILADGQVNTAGNEVFYFGNWVGDVDGDGYVGISDVFDIWDNRRLEGVSGPVSANYKYDLDHDGYVGISDVYLAWEHRKLEGVVPGLVKIQPVDDSLSSLSAAVDVTLAQAIASMNSRYSLSVVDTDDDDHYHLADIAIDDYLED